MTRPRRTAVAATLSAAVLLTAGALSGCSATVSVPVAEDANDPLCAEVSVRLSSVLAEQPRRWTDAQATAAWGDPTAVILSCGVTPPGPSTLECQTVGGVDWIIDDSQAPRYLVTTFGRTPAVQVYLDSEVVPSREVLDALSGAVSVLPIDGGCSERPSDG